MPTLIKTPCATSVLEFFGVYGGTTWNARTRKNVWPDTLRRNGWAVRSRLSKLGKRPTVGNSRAKLRAIAKAEPQIKAFVVRVPGHVMIISRNGTTLKDTAPRRRDSRRIVGVFAVWAK